MLSPEVLKKREDSGLSLPGKKNLLKRREFIFKFFATLVLLIFISIQISPASAVSDGVSSNQVGKDSSVITDFFSDRELSDATVRFEQPLEKVSLTFTLSSENKLLKTETFDLSSVESGQEIKKVLFWGLGENSKDDKESYTARIFVNDSSTKLASKEISFSYRNPVLSKLKLVDFSADSEKASILITLTGSTGFGNIKAPEPDIMDLDLKLLSGTEILYSETQKNIPVTDAYYKPVNWSLLLDRDKNYTALLKVHSHSPDITTAYRSDFKAEEKVEILDKDVDVDEYGASVTIVGKSQVPFDGIIKVVLTPKEGKEKVFEETADILTAGKEDTVGIVWQGISKGDYNVKIYVLNLKGEVLDSHETVLRVFEPVAQVSPVEKSPAFGIFAALGIFLFIGIFFRRKEK
jgi:hypothetical protein